MGVNGRGFWEACEDEGPPAGKCPVCGFPLKWRRARETSVWYKGCTNFDGGCRYHTPRNEGEMRKLTEYESVYAWQEMKRNKQRMEEEWQRVQEEKQKLEEEKERIEKEKRTWVSNPFEVLGVLRNATLTQVKESFWRLSKEWHPDTFHYTDPRVKEMASERFIKITRAYEEIKRMKGWI